MIRAYACSIEMHLANTKLPMREGFLREGFLHRPDAALDVYEFLIKIEF